MADPTGTHSDGAIAWGTQVVTIGTQPFILEKGSFKRGSRKLQTMDQNGLVNAKVHIKDPATNSITLQVPGNTVASPALFSVFTVALLGGGTISMILTEVGEETSNGGVSTIPCTAEEKIN